MKKKSVIFNTRVSCGGAWNEIEIDGLGFVFGSTETYSHLSMKSVVSLVFMETCLIGWCVVSCQVLV